MKVVKHSSSVASFSSDSVSSDTSHESIVVLDRPVGISGQDYARRVTKLIQLITELRAFGAQSVVDLPRIAVIGNQSAGKSSLVEALSGIPVPRASGTCTRCPMECRMQNSTGPWKCQVLLRYEKDGDGKRLDNVREEVFGPALFNKSEVGDMLRRAQLAILNPSVPAKRFVDYDLNNEEFPPLGSSKQLQFSSNVVCLDLQSPETTDLSFIDLPGIISNVAEGEDRNNIDLIRNLVLEHIQGNALILLTITMRDDIENQSAAFLAKQADPEGQRTIGVLTKPDTLQPGEHAAWLSVLEGRRHFLRHGYYVTKQPAIQELDQKVDHATARELEKQFFATNEHWTGVSNYVKNRTGVPKLTTELSRLLSQLIEQTIPKLRDDAKRQAAIAREGLSDLPPPPPKEPVVELHRLVSDFSRSVEFSVRGFDGHEKFIQQCRPVYSQLKKDMWSTRPNFFLESKLSISDKTSKADKRIETDVDADVDIYVEPIASPMSMQKVNEIINNSLTRELPFNIPYSVKTLLIRTSIDQWAPFLENCFEEVRLHFEEHVYGLVSRHFERFNHGGLYEHIRSVIERKFDSLKEDMRKRIEWMMKLEKHPFTQNGHYLSISRGTYLRVFREKAAQEIEKASKAAGTALSAAESKEKAQKFEQELIVMAEVAAYFKVAYKRIIDDMPRIIDVEFLQTFSENVPSLLISALELGADETPQRAGRLLSEEPNVNMRRKDLETTKERLDGILMRLFRFNTS